MENYPLKLAPINVKELKMYTVMVINQHEWFIQIEGYRLR